MAEAVERLLANSRARQGRQLRLGQGLEVAALEEHPAHTGPAGGLHVAGLVADHHRVSGRHGEIGQRAQQHAGVGLAVGMVGDAVAVLGGVLVERAEIDRVDARALRRQLGQHLGVEGFHLDL